MLDYESGPVTRDELPESFFPRGRQPIAYEELSSIAANGVKAAPLPPGQDKLKGLAPYRQRDPDGLRRSLRNLNRNVKKAKIDMPIPNDPNQPIAEPPAAVPTIPLLDSVQDRHLKTVFTKEEWDLYEATWIEWLNAHKDDYSEQEDLDDVRAICMETVVQHRLLAMQFNRQMLDISQPFNQSAGRKQKARENLSARRVDRVGTKANDRRTSIAVAAAVSHSHSLEDREVRAIESRQVAAKFLESTIPQRVTEERVSDEAGIDNQ